MKVKVDKLKNPPLVRRERLIIVDSNNMPDMVLGALQESCQELLGYCYVVWTVNAGNLVDDWLIKNGAVENDDVLIEYYGYGKYE